MSYSVKAARPQTPLGASSFHQWVLPDGSPWAQFFRTPSGYLLRFPDYCDFAVSSNGLETSVYPIPGLSKQTAEHLYLNQVLPLALSLQGKLVFHASAVEIDDTAVAFMGESGKGKSTLAAGFATAGHCFLTDDGLMVEPSENGYQVMPSHPSIRLWADSEAALISQDTPTAPALEFTTKSRFLAGESIPFCDTPRPLRRVYFLGDGSAAAITFQRMKPAEALIELVKHSFLLDIEEREMLLHHFGQLTELARLPMFFRLDYPRRYEMLPQVRDAVIRHSTALL